jgi:hypothetical protein
MLKFMVLGAPRSGTAWAANWLTTDQSLCIHDPLFRWHFDQLDKIESQNREIGVSCTGLALIPHFTDKHPARKVILHRPLEDINKSLLSINLPPLPESWNKALWEIEGLHVSWTDLFDPVLAKRIYELLLDRAFDAERHRELIDLNVQTNFCTVNVNKLETMRIFKDLQNIKDSLR